VVDSPHHRACGWRTPRTITALVAAKLRGQTRNIKVSMEASQTYKLLLVGA
jgi:hypothetical protein